jgi:hypothetical protein
LSDINILPTRSQWPLLSLQAYGPPESPYKVCIYLNTEAGIDCIAFKKETTALNISTETLKLWAVAVGFKFK